jgi:hypothetical protein
MIFLINLFFLVVNQALLGATNTVEHKNFQLNLYLDNIRYNTQEKIGILPYILAKPEGTYLEIGTGGDPIAVMLERIPQSAPTKIIASDVDERVLESLPVRHPVLKKYIGSQKGPSLVLQQLNAIDMSVIADQSLDGINASSVMHEILSYAGGFSAMEKFIKEAFRTLKSGGVLVYRDPEAVHNKKMQVSVTLKNKSIRLFAHIFLYKFLDSTGSSLARAGNKVALFNSDEVTFTIYKKNECQPITLSYKDYLQVPSYDIDFSRPYKLRLPLGLYRELARHYLTYLHVCNPLVFVKAVPDIQSNSYVVHCLAHSTSQLLHDFLAKKNHALVDGKIDQSAKNSITTEIEKNEQVLEFGIPFHFEEKEKQHKLRLLLKKYDLEPGTHSVAVSKNDFLLDYRVFGMLFDEVSEIFDESNAPLNRSEMSHAQWLKREGEEYYFYSSADELISSMLSITYQASVAAQVDGREYEVLCPLSADDSFFVDRLCYTELLSRSLEVYDSFGYTIPVKDGKRVIHFGKMPIKKALVIMEEIVTKEPLEYPRTRAVLESLKNQ